MSSKWAKFRLWFLVVRHTIGERITLALYTKIAAWADALGHKYQQHYVMRLTYESQRR